MTLVQGVAEFPDINFKDPPARLARSLHDLVVMVERIGKLGAGIKSLTEPFDTSNPFGRAAMGMIAVFAEFERELIRERTRMV